MARLSLELKIPPPALAFLIGLAMWGLSLGTTPLDVPASIRLSCALAIAVIGAGIALAGVLSFRRAKTTINPTRPQKASSLVCSGIYGITRNPMYVGLLLVLVGWSVYLAAPWALLGVAGFVFYIERFQIQPEERALAALFGAEFADYKERVRRWL